MEAIDFLKNKGITKATCYTDGGGTYYVSELAKLMEEYAALRQTLVSGLLPPDELEKALGSTNRQFTIWHDGGEWLISLKGKEQEQCKTLREWLGGNDR